MDMVIPAAGRGSRLGKLTDDRPKGLVDVAGRPLLAHVFETAVDAGADQLVVVVGYEAGQIVDRFGDVFAGVPITYVHQRERLGLGHAVLQAEPHVDGTFLLVNGDNVFAGSVAPALTAVEEADAALAVEGREASRAVIDARDDRMLRVARGCLSRVCATQAVGRGRVPAERGCRVVGASGLRGSDGSGG